MNSMNCPPEIAAVLLDILTQGLLLARSAGWAGDAQRAALEAEHLHNIPGLLKDFSMERLRYYWDAERPGYARCLTADDHAFWSPLWDKLRDLIENCPALTTVR
jgi:hypothetical protein